MPWDKMIQAFMANIPQRMAMIEQYPSHNRMFELREFRLLSLSGPRQCGKTQALIDFVKNVSRVKFCTPEFFLPTWKHQLDGRKFEETYLSAPDLTVSMYKRPVGDLQYNPFAGVKLFIMDGVDGPTYSDFIRMYSSLPEWFDPEFMVIRMD
jgi:hypothetical protein